MSQETRDRLRLEAAQQTEVDSASCQLAARRFCRALGIEEAKSETQVGGVFAEAVFVEEKRSGAEVYEYRLTQVQPTPSGGLGRGYIFGRETYPARMFIALIDVWIRAYQAIDGDLQLRGAGGNQKTGRLRLTDQGWAFVPAQTEKST